MICGSRVYNPKIFKSFCEVETIPECVDKSVPIYFSRDLSRIVNILISIMNLLRFEVVSWNLLQQLGIYFPTSFNNCIVINYQKKKNYQHVVV